MWSSRNQNISSDFAAGELKIKSDLTSNDVQKLSQIRQIFYDYLLNVNDKMN